ALRLGAAAARVAGHLVVDELLVLLRLIALRERFELRRDQVLLLVGYPIVLVRHRELRHEERRRREEAGVEQEREALVGQALPVKPEAPRDRAACVAGRDGEADPA